jgi:hypothetical protein
MNSRRIDGVKSSNYQGHWRRHGPRQGFTPANAGITAHSHVVEVTNQNNAAKLCSQHIVIPESTLEI